MKKRLNRQLISHVMIFILFMAKGCRGAQENASTLLVISPYDSEGTPITGAILIYSLEEGFATPYMLFDCDPERRNECLEEELEQEPCYDYTVYLIPGTYRIVAYDTIQQKTCRQDIAITGQEHRCLHISIEI